MKLFDNILRPISVIALMIFLLVPILCFADFMKPLIRSGVKVLPFYKNCEVFVSLILGDKPVNTVTSNEFINELLSGFLATCCYTVITSITIKILIYLHIKPIFTVSLIFSWVVPFFIGALVGKMFDSVLSNANNMMNYIIVFIIFSLLLIALMCFLISIGMSFGKFNRNAKDKTRLQASIHGIVWHVMVKGIGLDTCVLVLFGCTLNFLLKDHIKLFLVFLYLTLFVKYFMMNFKLMRTIRYEYPYG